jgi:hypothetical protein
LRWRGAFSRIADQRAHSVSFRQQSLQHILADKTSAACEKDFHTLHSNPDFLIALFF